MSKSDGQPELQSVEEIEKSSRLIRRGLNLGLVLVIAIVVTMIFIQPAGFAVIIAFLIVFEGISYPLFKRKLDQATEERISEAKVAKRASRGSS